MLYVCVSISVCVNITQPRKCSRYIQEVKLSKGASVVVRWVKPAPTTPASCVGLPATVFPLQLPTHGLGKAGENDPSIWALPLG